ncbi:MAG: hypothetical protein LQ338_002255 [Usnochroma carphineum]|nr:MAG: hypothetical protein LQ338_002255 [Usnochroma carphineum]
MPLRWLSAGTYSKLSLDLDGVDANEKEEIEDDNLDTWLFKTHEGITRPTALSKRAAITIFAVVALIASGAGFATGVMVSGNKEALPELGTSATRDGLGYVNEATNLGKGNFSVISVFHQMHCLYTLRRAYYSNGTGGEDFDFGLERNQHVAHCFEYLRQSIQCSADSTIEPAEHAANGFLGWGFPRMCRDYTELSHWAEKRRAFDGHGFLAHPKIHSIDDAAQK